MGDQNDTFVFIFYMQGTYISNQNSVLFLIQCLGDLLGVRLTSMIHCDSLSLNTGYVKRININFMTRRVRHYELRLRLDERLLYFFKEYWAFTKKFLTGSGPIDCALNDNLCRIPWPSSEYSWCTWAAEIVIHSKTDWLIVSYQSDYNRHSIINYFDICRKSCENCMSSYSMTGSCKRDTKVWDTFCTRHSYPQTPKSRDTYVPRHLNTYTPKSPYTFVADT